MEYLKTLRFEKTTKIFGRAIRNGYPEIVRYCFDSVPKFPLQAAIGSAAEIGDLEIFQFLAQGVEGLSSFLFTACHKGHLSIVDFILQKERLKNDRPLYEAVDKGFQKIVERLLRYDCEQVVLNTCLSHAVTWNHPDLVRLIYQRGADPSTLNNYLTETILAERTELLEVLFEIGVDLSSVDENLYNHDLETVQFLRDHLT